MLSEDGFSGSTASNHSLSAGFTLIELVVVIVLLGILAAFALPRFASLGTDSRIATLEGVAGSVRSAASIVYVACLADSDCDTEAPAPNNPANTSNSIVLEGEPVTLAFGYPRHSAETGIQRAAKVSDSDFLITIDANNASGYTDIAIENAPDPEACRVRYQQPSEAGSSPGTELTTSGC